MIYRGSFKRLFLIVTFASAALLAVDGTQVMRRPDNYKDPLKTLKTELNPKINSIHRRSSSKVSFAYFTNWGIYGANFQPTNIVPSPLTHILYAFADIDTSTSAIKLTDLYADEQKHFPGDSWSEPGNNLYGCLKQLYLLKLKQRNLKVLLSIGGWTYSQSGHFSFVTSPASRATFVSSAVQLIEDYGFDGVDLDFEYPASAAQGQGFADLITELRAAFMQLQFKKGDIVPYQITAAVSAGPANYQYLVVPQMNAGLSYWNLMAYDYAGSWLTFADNQANLYGGARTGVSTDAAVKWFTSHGAAPFQINMGMPLYGRAFENTTGIGQPYNGVGPGTLSAGIYSYNVLPLAGAQVFENTTDVTSYSYDFAKKELVSYDTPHIVTLKAQYIISQGLSGSMFWELSTDKVGSESLVGTAAGVMGTLDQTQNHIDYPNSKWDNIRSNMGSISSVPPAPTSTSTSTPPPTSTSASPTTTSTPPPTTTSTPPPTTTSTPPPTSTSTLPPASTTTSGACNGVAAWSSTIAYSTPGTKVTYGGHLWTNKWWTEADKPGGAAGVWTDVQAC